MRGRQEEGDGAGMPMDKHIGQWVISDGRRAAHSAALRVSRCALLSSCVPLPQPPARLHTPDAQDLTNGNVVVNTLGPHEGRFTFTSHDPGDHNICLHTNLTTGWMGNDHIKMYLDVNVGSSKKDTA